MNTLDQQQFQLAIEKCGDSPLDALWEILGPIHQRWTHFPGEVTGEFSSRTNTFFWILERLLHEGRIKLHKDGVFLEGSIEEQIERFRDAWPATDKPYPEHPDAGFALWFFDPECPAGVAWRKPDGSYQIAD